MLTAHQLHASMSYIVNKFEHVWVGQGRGPVQGEGRALYGEKPGPCEVGEGLGTCTVGRTKAGALYGGTN